MQFTRFVLRLLFLFVSAPLWAYDAPEGYYFSAWHVDITVHEDNSCDVIEMLDVNFLTEKHGIIQSYPSKIWINRDISEQQDGSLTQTIPYRAEMSDVWVNAPYSFYEEDDCYFIRIGSSTEYVSGPKHIEISYHYAAGNDRVTQSDLFFRSILGDDVCCSVSSFTFSIHFDKPLPEASLSRLQLFKGAVGNKTDYASEVVTTKTATLIKGMVSDVPAYNAVTVWIPLPEGYFNVPMTYPWWYYAIVILCVISILLAIYVLMVEFRYKGEPITVVSYGPPANLPSAELGVVYDTTVDDCDLLSLIPWFAYKRYLKITNEDTEYVLHKLQPLPADAPKYQQTLFNAFFPKEGKDVFNMEGAGTVKFGEKWNKCKDQLHQQYKDKLNELLGAPYALLLLALVVAAVAFCFCVEDEDSLFICFCGQIGALGFISVMHVGHQGHPFSWSGRFIYFFIDLGCTLVFLALYWMGLNRVWFDPLVPHWLFGITFSIILVACILAHRLTRISEFRRQHIGEIRGFYEYIDKAEHDELEKMVEQDEQYYYHILPYAVAFGLAEKWTRKFDGILSDMQDAPCPRDTRFLKVLAANNAITSSAVKFQESQAKKSSGSSYHSSHSYGGGGGGYSGGGFGGGGSHSW